MKKIGKRFWALFLIFTMLLGYVPEGMTFFAGNDLEVSDQIAAPVSTAEAGTYDDSVVTFLSSETKDATIYYTLNNENVTAESKNLYQKYVMMTGKAGKSVTTTLRAIAVAEIDGKLMRSEVATYVFTIQMGSTVTLIWEGLLSPENGITPDGSYEENGVTKYYKDWTIPYGESFADVTYVPTDAAKYYFPEGYGSVSSNGILVNRVTSSQIKVSGTPIADVRIELVTPSEIKNPDNTPGEELPDGEKLYFGSYPDDIEYGDKAIILAAGGYGAGNVTYKSSDETIATVNSKGEVTIVGIGTFTITATKAASDGFTAQSITTDPIQAIQREVTITEILADGKVYDGTKDVIVSGAVLDDLVEGDTVVITADSNEAVAKSANAGSQPLEKLPTYTISGEDAYKYNLVQPKPSDVTVTIEKFKLDVIGFVANDKIYDGTTAATIKTMGTIDLSGLSDLSSAMLEEVKNLSVVEAEDASAVSFADANVARDAQGAVISKTVVVNKENLALEGEGAGNFEIATATAENATINPKDVQISVKEMEADNGYIFAAGLVLTVEAVGILEADKDLVTLPVAKLKEQLVARTGTVKHENVVSYEYEENAGNYNFVTDTSVSVKGKPLYVQPEDLTYVSNGTAVEGYTSETWYKDLDLKPSGVNGYTEISFDGVTWQSIVSLDSQVADGSAEAKTLTIYLRKATGETTEPYEEVKCSIDKSKPTAKITVKEDVFKTFLNELTFGLFFTETINVTFEGEDTGSGIKNLFYYKYDYETDLPEDISYTVINGEKHTIQCKPGDVNKFYLKVKDDLGHESDEVSSTGVVVHKPLEIKSTDHEYRNGSEKFNEPKIEYTPNNNIVEKVTIEGKDINFSIDGNKIILKDSADLDAILSELFAELPEDNETESITVQGVVTYYQSGYAAYDASRFDATFDITFTELKVRDVDDNDFDINDENIENSKVYDGIVTELSNVLIYDSVEYSNVELLIYKDGKEVTQMRDAGHYTLYAYIPEDNEYCYYKEELGQYEITKKDLSITGLKGKDREYNGNENSGNLGYSGNTVFVITDEVQFDGLVDGDNVSVKVWNNSYGGQAIGEMDTPDAGENKAVKRFNVSLEGVHAGNYNLTGHNEVTVNIARAKINVALKYNYTDIEQHGALLQIIDDSNSATAPGTIFVWKRGCDLAPFTKGNTELTVYSDDSTIKGWIASSNITYSIVPVENEELNTATGSGFYGRTDYEYHDARDGYGDLYVKVAIDDTAFKAIEANKNYELVDTVFVGKIRLQSKEVKDESGKNVVLTEALDMSAEVGINHLSHWAYGSYYYYDFASNKVYILAPNKENGYKEVSIDGGANFYDYIIYTENAANTTIDQIKETPGYKKYVEAGAIDPDATHILITEVPARSGTSTISQINKGIANSFYGSICARSDDGWATIDIRPDLWLEREPIGSIEVVNESTKTTISDSESGSNYTYYFDKYGRGYELKIKVPVGTSRIYYAKVWDGVNTNDNLEAVILSTDGEKYGDNYTPIKIENHIMQNEKYATITIFLSQSTLGDLLGENLVLEIKNRANQTVTYDIGRIMVTNETPTIEGTINGEELGTGINNTYYLDEEYDVEFTVTPGGNADYNVFQYVKYTLNGVEYEKHTDIIGKDSLTIPYDKLQGCENTITVSAKDYCDKEKTVTYYVYVKENPTMDFDQVPTEITYDIGYQLEYVVGTDEDQDLNDKIFVVNGNSNGEVTFTSTNPEVAEIEDNKIIIHKAGTFTIKAEVAETNKYLAGSFESDTITVSKREIVISGISATDRPYDATTDVKLDVSGITYTGIVPGQETEVIDAIDILSFKNGTKKGTSAQKDVGEDIPVTIPEIEFTGENEEFYANKYEIVEPTGLTVDISKKPLTFVIKANDYGSGNSIEVDRGTYLDPNNFTLDYLTQYSGIVDAEEPEGFVWPTVDVSTIPVNNIADNARVTASLKGGEPTNNYRFEYAVIVFVTVNSVAVEDGDYELYKEDGVTPATPNANGWYNENVVIKPTGDYDKISDNSTANSSNKLDNEILSDLPDEIRLENDRTGSKSFFLRDEDGLGTITQVYSATINIDKTAPTVEFEEFSNIGKDSVVIKVSATDTRSGIDTVTLTYEGCVTPIAMSKDAETGYYVAELPVGIYENITVLAVDKAGNTDEDTYTETVIADNTSPTVDVTMTGSTVESEKESDKYYTNEPTVEVTVEDLDSKIDYIYYTLNQGDVEYVDEVNGESSVIFDITGLVRGRNVIQIVAVDKAGNRTETPVTVLVTEYQGDLSFTITGVTVSDGTQMSYGDEYKVNVSQNDPSPEKSPLSYHINLDDQDVAIVDAEGNITIVGVGTFTLYVTKGAIPGYFEAVESFEYTTYPKEITIEGIDAVDRDYDGSNIIIIDSDNATLVGTLEGDDVGFTAPEQGTVTDKNAAEGHKEVTMADIELTGDKAAYYKLIKPELTVVISRKDVTVSVEKVTIDKGQDLSKSELEVVITGLVPGESLSPMPKAIYNDTVNTLNPSITSFYVVYENEEEVDAAATNYDITYENTVVLDINKVDIGDVDVDYYFKDGKNPTEWNNGELVIYPKGEYTWISTNGTSWYRGLSLSEGKDADYTFYLKKDDGTQTESKTITYKLDTTAPSVEFKYHENGLFRDGFELEGLAGRLYNLFFKQENVNVTLKASDNFTAANKVIVEYKVLNLGEEFTEEGTWETYNSLIGINCGEKKVIYVRITDLANNKQILASNGIVVYKDSKSDTERVEYTKKQDEGELIEIEFNGNEIDRVEVYKDEVFVKELKLYNDYFITDEGIVLNTYYLDTLEKGLYDVIVFYDPLGEDYVEDSDSVAPNVTSAQLYVGLATLKTSDFSYTAPSNLEYNANAKAAAVTCGKPGIGAINVTYKDKAGNIVDEPTNVGEYTVIVSVEEGKDYQAVNSFVVGSFTITAKTITLTGLTGVDRTYNGSKEVTLSGGTLVGVCDGDVVTPVIPETGMVANADVADAKAVTVETITLTGADKANYTLVQPTDVTVDITKATLSVSVNLVTIDKGQAIPVLTATVTGFVNEETVNSVGVVIPTVTVKGSVDTLDTAITEFEVEYANGNPTANYEFSYDKFVDLTINEVYVQAGDYVVEANNGITEWNKDKVVILPANEYTKISTDGVVWVDKLELEEEGVKSVTFYLKKADGTQTEANTLEYKLDNTDPTVEFSFNGGLFQDGLSGIFGQIYNLFFKNNVNVTIKADDNLSAVNKIEYQVIEDSASIEESALPNNWKAYNNAFGINANQKAVVYVRLTDNAGNVSIYHSKGVVVYKDSEVVDAFVEYTKKATDDLLLGITFNENTIKDVTFDGVTLPTDKYVITANGIEIDNAYLDTLTAGIHNVVVSYNPYGVDYKEGEQNQAPATTTFRVNVKLATLTKDDFAFVAPENLGYNAEAKLATVTCNKDGIGTITVKYYDANNQVVVNPTDAGTYTVKVSTTDGFTYAAFAETEVGTFTITEKEITLIGLTGVDRTYNGSKEVALSGGTLVGVCGGDVVTPVIPATGTMANADVANAKAVTVGTITLAGADAANYTLVQPTDVTVDITTATLSVSVNPVVIKKGQAVPALTVTVTGFVNGETTELTGFVAPTATLANTVDTTNKDLTSFVVVYEGGNATNNYVFDLSNTTAQITINTVEANIIVSPTDITGWVNENVVITPGTGFDLISTNGRDWSSSVTLTESGAAEVTVYTKNSTDGTLSEAKTVTYKIDKVNPVIGDITYSSDVITTDNKIINNGEFDINVVVSDALSDVANVTYTLHYADGTNVTKNAIVALGNNSTYALAAVDTVSKYAIIEVPEDFVGTISMVVKDNVGNTTEAILANGKTFIADVTAPEVNITLGGEEIVDGDSLKCTDTIDITVTDLHAGVKEFTYFVNGVEVEAIELALGENTVKVVATDFAGNEITKTVKVTVKHDWSIAPVFTWAEDNTATATFICGNDASHKATKDCTVTSVTTDPACEEIGATVYTAKVTFEGKEYTATKAVEIDALGHAYGAPVFTWAADNTATATFTCTRNAEHVVVVNATVTSVTTPATCETAGQTVYTATVEFNGATYTDTKTVAIEKLGHVYGAAVFTWAEDNTATATFTCTRNAEHVVVVNATVTSVTTPATCETAGQTVYTATVEFNGETYTDTKTVAIDALGHAYGTPVFVWDGTTATATVTCGNDETHVIALEVEVTEVTTAPTCEEAGAIVYTATATFEDEDYTDSKVVEIPALGHDWVIGMDEENHWKECTREDCTAVKETEAHTLDYVSNDNASMLQNATETATCHCGYTHTREIPNTMIKEEMKEEVVEEETVGNGSVSTQVNKDEELPKTEIENLTTDVAKDLLTEKELQKVEDGATILVYLDVRNADETAPKKDKEKAEEHVEKHVQSGKVGMYLDLSLFKKIGDDAASKITNTEGNFIEITIDVPKNLTNHNPHVTRTFYVVRVHDGVAEIISEGTTASTITFKTDRFSTYAIVYSDVSTAEKAPVTGDATNWYWYMMLMVAGLGVLTAGMKKQRR